MCSESRNDQYRRIGGWWSLRDRENIAGISDNSAEIGDYSAEIVDYSAEIGDDATGIVDITAKVIPC